MTNRDQIWKRANESTEARCLAMLRTIFPSLAYDFTPSEFGITRSLVDNKDDALKKMRIGLNRITEVEAAYYISVLDQKRPTSSVKF